VKRLKKILFWIHLVLGLAGGLVIAVLAFTGAALAFEPQIRDVTEQHLRFAPPPAVGAMRLPPGSLIVRAEESTTGKKATSIVLESAADSPAVVQLGRGHTVYLNAYSGAVLGQITSRGFFGLMLDIHRRLAFGPVGENIVGAANVSFSLLCLTGLYLWWPRTVRALRTAAWPRLSLRGKALHWNLHNAIGVWALPVLVAVSLTGLVFSYTWAGDLIYTLTRTTKPTREPAAVTRFDGAQPISLDAAWRMAENQSPGWQRISHVVPAAPESISDVTAAPWVFSILEADAPHHTARTRLVIDPYAAQIVAWEPFSSWNLGRQIRSFVLPVHMGYVFGLPGQIVVFAASLGALVLVVTGFTLSWKRLSAWRTRRRTANSRRAVSTCLPFPVASTTEAQLPARVAASAQAVGSENHTHAGERHGREPICDTPPFRATPVKSTPCSL
jgi:uncharacterized iron-regulated membrane protein